MEELKETIKAFYEELKGTRVINGELKIEGFNYEAYEELYRIILNELSPLFDGNYWNWYEKQTLSYIRKRKGDARCHDFYCPQMRGVYDHTVREQLAVIKYFLSRRSRGKYTQ